jgi:RNA polymerase sigma-70 factor (ECF subfamily)
MTDINVLIERWQSGDQRAAEALYNHHREPTFRLAYGILGNPADAEEAAQDALTYALTNIRRYDPQRASFGTWLHTIAVSRCRDRLRRRRLPQFSLTNWLQGGGDAPDPAPSQEQQVVSAETHGEIWTAVQALSPALREAVLLRYWAGHTYREMAEILHCPLPTAQSRVRLAYQHLRAALSSSGLADLEGLDFEEKRIC